MTADDLIMEAFLLGFMSSIEGYNGECSFDHLAPKTLCICGEYRTALMDTDEFNNLLNQAIEKINKLISLEVIKK